MNLINIVEECRKIKNKKSRINLDRILKVWFEFLYVGMTSEQLGCSFN
jgi:hypothetical protein